jgi:hypothetical protein
MSLSVTVGVALGGFGARSAAEATPAEVLFLAIVKRRIVNLGRQE